MRKIIELTLEQPILVAGGGGKKPSLGSGCFFLSSKRRRFTNPENRGLREKEGGKGKRIGLPFGFSCSLQEHTPPHISARGGERGEKKNPPPLSLLSVFLPSIFCAIAGLAGSRINHEPTKRQRKEKRGEKKGRGVT